MKTPDSLRAKAKAFQDERKYWITLMNNIHILLDYAASNGNFRYKLTQKFSSLNDGPDYNLSGELKKEGFMINGTLNKNVNETGVHF